jgi:tripartite-type tricarboxylate transporter receptor subunit TctC
MRLASVLSAAVTLLIAGIAPAVWAQPDETLKGRTVTLIIGSDAGGGIDLYGRVVARHIGKHLPGQPSVVAQNMPAAGSIAAANYLFHLAPKDGTAIGILSQGLILDEILGTPGLRFEVAKFNWVGRVSSDVLITFTWHTSKVKTIADAMTVETTLGGTGAGSNVTKSPQLLNLVVGTKFKVIVGYSGTGASMLATERGELDGMSDRLGRAQCGAAELAQGQDHQSYRADGHGAPPRHSGRAVLDRSGEDRGRQEAAVVVRRQRRHRQIDRGAARVAACSDRDAAERLFGDAH